jgi:3',5'-cyclic AMP phosphodiesterase CpdA
MLDAKVIIQLTDLHIPSSGNLYGSIDAFQNVVEILKALEVGGKLDLLLLTGDLADDAEPEAYRRLRSIIEPFAERLDVPVMYLPGNHDKRKTFRPNLLDLDESNEPSDQVRWCGDLRVIGLDTAIEDAHGELEDRQLAWLDAELARPAPLGTVLALHHPPIPGPIEATNLIGLHDPERLAAVVANRDVKMIVAGHAHHATAGALAGVPVWVSAATVFQIDIPASDEGYLRGIPGSGFTRIDVTSEGAVASHIPMQNRSQHLFDVDLDLMMRRLRGEVSREELHDAFAHSSSVE